MFILPNNSIAVQEIPQNLNTRNIKIKKFRNRVKYITVQYTVNKKGKDLKKLNKSYCALYKLHKLIYITKIERDL